jgi:hypothetical protein
MSIKIFISYPKRQPELPRLVADLLESAGYTVWWDTRLIIGQFFRRAIKQKLDAADAVIVIWTPYSVSSKWVIAEASRADDRGVLIPLRTKDLDPRQIPLPYSEYQTGVIEDHTGVIDDHEAILDAVKLITLNITKNLESSIQEGYRDDELKRVPLRRARVRILHNPLIVISCIGIVAFIGMFFFGAQSNDLSGSWICVSECQERGGYAAISQNNLDLLFTNEIHQVSTGRWVSDTQVLATSWGQLGNVGLGGRTISWNNKGRWVRPFRCFFTNSCS